ncbi:hypothetical protein D8674_028495 [Pyrus ussuriensis x Pyrus communis]|uniref:RNase H type-1 domain-containing protein n=1 Tax=Pyrus ussuriensis x Pyrus communis TaxID=2448454 RepID=A0A5N5HXF8_9ROSA|nr:hypothetical protein D8674_028495 [Pyrus ussuriensis x Pyrus communis]
MVSVGIRSAGKEILIKYLIGILAPMQAEIATAREAAVFLHQWRTEQIILEGDALLVITAIQNNAMVNHGPFGLLLKDTQRILQSFKSWKASFVRRNANSMAHRLAKFSLTLDHPVSWFEEPPDLISDLLLEDGFHSSCFVCLGG